MEPIPGIGTFGLMLFVMNLLTYLACLRGETREEGAARAFCLASFIGTPFAGGALFYLSTHGGPWRAHPAAFAVLEAAGTVVAMATAAAIGFGVAAQGRR